MRVATLNIWGTRGAWEERREVLRAGFAALAPDLVALQETIRTDGYDQVRELLPGYHLVHSTERETDGQGITIASRWPFGEIRELDLYLTPRTKDFANTALVAEIEAPEPYAPLLFVNHFPSYKPPLEHERLLQAVRVATFVEDLVARRGGHAVVAGDLDADPDSASIRFWTGRQPAGDTSVCYRDAWERVHPGEPGTTLTPDNPLFTRPDWPFRRIDYLLVRCDTDGPTLHVTSCERIFDQPTDGVWASDHFGVVADLEPR
jgi:endonuclease/exonuclease/phosphatase family metal-dependent hydrolase